MALTKIGSIGINTGIAFAGVTTIATLNASDNVLSVGGTVNFVSDVSIGGTVSIAGTLTYEDVTNVDAVGLITARDGIKVGSGITLSKDGDIFFTGIITGNGSGLTGVSGVSVANQADNRLITATGTTDALNGESELTYSTYLGLSRSSTDTNFGDNSAPGTVHGFFTNNTQSTNGVFSALSLAPNNSSGTNQAGSFIAKSVSGGYSPEIHIGSRTGDNTTESNFKITSDRVVELRYQGSTKLATSNTGVTVTGTLAATAVTGDGSALTGIEAGIQTSVPKSVSGITTVLDLSKDDFKITAAGITTIDVRGGSEGNSHTLRIHNSGITTVGFSTYFLFPSGSSPIIPTADGTISLISFTVDRQGAVGLATQLLAGASVNFS